MGRSHSYMVENTREELGMLPLEPAIKSIDTVKDKAALVTLVARLQLKAEFFLLAGMLIMTLKTQVKMRSMPIKWDLVYLTVIII